MSQVMDKKKALEIVQASGWEFKNLPDDSLKKDKEIVLAAVKQDGGALQYADDSFKKDKEIVLIAVKNNGLALEYADDSLKKDKEIVLIAVKQYGTTLEYADDSLKKDKEIVDAAVKQDNRASQYADISLKKYYKITKEIYIKTEPGGRVAFGKLDKTQEELFYKNYSKKKDILIEIPKKNNEYEEGLYLTYLSLSKVSIQFEFEIKDKKEFDPKQFKEISVPIKLPNIIEHERYRHPNFNIVIDYLYKDEPIEEFQSHGNELVDRGYDDQIIFFEVKDGKTKILYSSYNGVGKFF